MVSGTQALAAIIVVAAVLGWGEARYHAGKNDCEDAQAKADDAVTEAAAPGLDALDSVDDQQQETIDEAEDSYTAAISMVDVRTAYKRGRDAGRRQAQDEAVEQARARGGCLVEPYDDDDGLLASARSQQDALFGRRDGRDGGTRAAPVPAPAESIGLAGRRPGAYPQPD